MAFCARLIAFKRALLNPSYSTMVGAIFPVLPLLILDLIYDGRRRQGAAITYERQANDADSLVA